MMEHEIAHRRVVMKFKVTDLRGNITKPTFQITGMWEGGSKCRGSRGCVVRAIATCRLIYESKLF